MCIVSAITQDWRDKFEKRFPGLNPVPSINFPPGYQPHPVDGLIFPPLSDPNDSTHTPAASPTWDEFNRLKKEVESLKELLKHAQVYDAETGQAECEEAEKVAFVRNVADFVGVNLDEVFGAK